MLPEELATATGIPRATIYSGLAGGHMSARNLAVIRPVLRISHEELEAELVKDFKATTDSRSQAAELRDQLQDLVDADPDDEAERGSV